ncbi:MAG: PatB family C-S lyase [Phototrophicaceae bacterium]
MATKVYDFETRHDRSNTYSVKWTSRKNDQGILVPVNDDTIPLWVAEMEFPNPPEIREAMKRRIDHGFFGYTFGYDSLKNVIADRMKTLYGWDVKPEWILFNPGMVLFVSNITQALTTQGAGIIMNTPLYGPLLTRPKQYQRFAQTVPMVRVADDANTFHYEIDFEAFETSITAETEMYYLCNPHNPVGKSFTADELKRLGDICVKHDILIVSDDIHSDLILGDASYTPIASLSKEIEQNSIVLLAGTKTFNMAGIACSVAIIPNDDMRAKVDKFSSGSGSHADLLSYDALLAGYTECGEWLQQVRAYLTANRDFTVNFIREHLPMVQMTVPDGTYMTWVDFSDVNYPEKYQSVTEFLAIEANVAYSPGSFFGDGLDNYVRLNFACPRPLLQEALERTRDAINDLSH